VPTGLTLKRIEKGSLLSAKIGVVSSNVAPEISKDTAPALQPHQIAQELIALFHSLEGCFSLTGSKSRDVCAVILEPRPGVWGE
jgi:hypothetical protein